MKNALNRDTNTINVATFWENHKLKKYNYDPSYQRRSVWSEEKQSFFIDSLLKNFPIPPIFLRQKINNETGATTYDVIDGKQRLTSIINFLNNDIPVADENESESSFHDTRIAGVYFKDFDNEPLQEYKGRLWRYVIPVEYIDTAEESVIDNLFDRLNRNGEPLTGQELRKAKYHTTALLKLVEELTQEQFWTTRLEHTDVKRMEHYEFISELIFQQIQQKALGGSPSAILDKLYKNYTENENKENWKVIKKKFKNITNYMKSLEIDYDLHRVVGVSHLYGLWCLSHHCYINNVVLTDIKSKLNEFFRLRAQKVESNNTQNAQVEEYKKSMASRTKSEIQRRKRFEALKKFLEI